jgi:hypothetical protein
LNPVGDVISSAGSIPLSHPLIKKSKIIDTVKMIFFIYFNTMLDLEANIKLLKDKIYIII